MGACRRVAGRADAVCEGVRRQGQRAGSATRLELAKYRRPWRHERAGLVVHAGADDSALGVTDD
jgi:hypothetical protein